MTDDRRSLARAAWHTASSRPVYANRWIRVREDVAVMPDGRRTLYGVIECRPAVGVLAFVDPHTIVLVGQYRYVARAFLWEIPTGAMDEGESEVAAAQRELAEEAGYRAARLEKLGTFDTSKSVMDETAHLYVATGLTRVEQAGDETEFIEVTRVPFDQALAMVDRGEIRDGMTIVAILQWARRNRGGPRRPPSKLPP
jgi:ADP-ribose pyrophosphatase